MISEAMLLRLELQELQDRYVACLDGDRLEAWPGFFVEDGRYEIIPRENADAGFPAPVMLCEGAAMLRDRVISLRHANIYARPAYRHALSGLVVGAVGEEIATTTSYLVVNTSPDGASSVYQAGRYEDRVVRVEGGLRFKSKRVIYDTSRIQTALAYPI